MEEMPSGTYLAFDLGAESGRGMLGRLEGGRLALEELHRFPSAMRRVKGTLRWDVLQIFEEMRECLRRAGKRVDRLDSVSTDSWGVDYVLMREGEPFLTVPFHYRDVRTVGGFDRVFGKVGRDRIFARTGIQFMELNTLYQLEDDLRRRREVLDLSDGFLLIGDYFNCMLGGRGVAEVSLASTTQLFDPRSGGWAYDLADDVGIPRRLMPEVVASGTRLGELEGELARESQLDGVQVVASCSHDTAAAVAAVPAQAGGGRWAFLSSGTWSLLGLELEEPIISDRSMELNLTNEVGFGGKIRFLKNIIGLWILQECRREWESDGVVLSYEEVVKLAEEAAPFRSLIHPNDERFGRPGGMLGKVALFCRESGQPEPRSPGEYARCILESLALLYGKVLEDLEEVSGWDIGRLHVVGGGCRNHLLNQLTADATGCEVVAGPVEATAMGNVLVQAVCLGHLGGLEEIREVVRASSELGVYFPSVGWEARWVEARERFRGLERP